MLKYNFLNFIKKSFSSCRDFFNIGYDKDEFHKKNKKTNLSDKTIENDNPFSGLSNELEDIDHAWSQIVISKINQAIPLPIDKSLKHNNKNGSFGMDQQSFHETMSANRSIKPHYETLERLPKELFSWYISHTFLGYDALGLMMQQPNMSTICSLKGDDAVKNGYDIISTEDEVSEKYIKRIEKLDKKYKVKLNLTEAHKFNNIFGIRHILFIVEFPDDEDEQKKKEYYEEPFNEENIVEGTYKGISQIDPYWITPNLDTESSMDPTSIHFQDPTYWFSNGIKYHRSHFIILRGQEVPDILKPTYRYGGISLIQQVYQRVYASDRTANEAPLLALTKRSKVMHLDLSKAMSKGISVLSKLEEYQKSQNNYGMQVVGKEDLVTQFDTSLSDLDDIILSQYQLVASIIGVPFTRFMGTTPKGFQATGEYELKTYHEILSRIQENEFTDIVNRHHIYLIRSEIAPDNPFEVDISWKPIDIPTEKEKAEIQKIKSETMLNLQNSGSIDSYDIRDALKADKNSGYNDLEYVERPSDIEELNPLRRSDLGVVNDYSNKVASDENIGEDFIKEENGSWYVYSESGNKLGGPYGSKQQANERLAEIEYFKNKK